MGRPNCNVGILVTQLFSSSTWNLWPQQTTSSSMVTTDNISNYNAQKRGRLFNTRLTIPASEGQHAVARTPPWFWGAMAAWCWASLQLFQQDPDTPHRKARKLSLVEVLTQPEVGIAGPSSGFWAPPPQPTSLERYSKVDGRSDTTWMELHGLAVTAGVEVVVGTDN